MTDRILEVAKKLLKPTATSRMGQVLFLLFELDSEPVVPGSYVEVGESTEDDSDKASKEEESARPTRGESHAPVGRVTRVVPSGEVPVVVPQDGQGSRTAVSTTSSRMASLLKRKLAVMSKGEALKKTHQESEALQGESSVQPQEESSGRREVPEETRVVTRGRSKLQTSSPVEVYDLATARRLVEQLLRCFQEG